MNAKFFAVSGMLLLAVYIPTTNAGLIAEADFGSSANTYTFTGPTVTTSDFGLSGGSWNSSGWNFYNQLTIDFTSEVSAVGIYINRGKTGSILMEVYDTANVLQEDHSFSGLNYPSFIGLDVGTNSIDMVSFKVNDDIFVDHVIYQETNSMSHAPTVPAPGAFLLASLGAGAVGFMRRRRTL